MQKASPPPLLPLLRSRLRAETLTLVLLGPEEEWPLTGLAARTGASVSSVQREITRAEQAGVVRSRRLGNVRLVKAADSPLTAPLTEARLSARWTSSQPSVHIVELRIGQGHRASRRVAVNAGFVPAGTVTQFVPGTGQTFHDLRYVLAQPETTAQISARLPAERQQRSGS